MNSARIRSRQQAGSSVSAVLNPVNGVRDAMRRRGHQPKDHAMNNVRMIRDMQRKNRMIKQAEESHAGSSKYKMPRFRNVKSKTSPRRGGGGTARSGRLRSQQSENFSSGAAEDVPPGYKATPVYSGAAGAGGGAGAAGAEEEEEDFGIPGYRPTRVAPYPGAGDDYAGDAGDGYSHDYDIDEPAGGGAGAGAGGAGGASVAAGSPTGGRAATAPQHKFLRRGSGKMASRVTKLPPQAEVTGYRRDKGAAKPAVPKAHEVAQLAPRTDADFIHKNARKAMSSKPIKPTADAKKRPATYGKVPKYLQTRKAQQAAEAEWRARNAPDPDCPPGMTMMPDSERLETLRVLQQSSDDVKEQMRRLPLRIETPSQIRRQAALEAKLKEVEDAIKIFSREKVFVQDG